MALLKTGYTNKSTENFVIDAGTIYSDFSYADGEFTGTPLGATNGGVSIAIALTYRKREVDGTYIMDVKGLDAMESAACTATATLKEITAENLRKAINGVMTNANEDEAPAGYKKITGKRYVEMSDYIPNIAISGIHNGTKQPIVFVLDNALVTSEMTLATADNGEASFEITFRATASIEQLQADEFPWRIFYPGTATAQNSETPSEENTGNANPVG